MLNAISESIKRQQTIVFCMFDETVNNIDVISSRSMGGKGRGKLRHKCKNRSSKLHDSQSEYASSNAKQRPVCWVRSHALKTLLTSIGSILT